MPNRDADRHEPTRGASDAAPARGARPRPAAPPGNRGASPTPPPAVAGAPDALSLLKALRRRWALALSVSLLAAALAGAAMWLLVPSKVMAFSTVQIAGREQKLSGGAYSPNDLNQIMKTQKDRFKSRDVLLRALQKEEVRKLGVVRRHDNPFSLIAWLDEEIKVDTQDNSEIMQISMTGEEADELVVLVNGLTKAYLEIVNGKEKADRTQRVEKVKGVANALREELRNKIVTRQSLYKSHGAPGSPEMMLRMQAYTSQLNEAIKQLGALEWEAEKIKSRMAAHAAGKKMLTPEDVPDTALTRMLESDTIIKPKLALIGKLETILMRLDAAGTRSDDPTMREVVRKLSKLRAEVDSHRDRLRADLLEQHAKKVDGDHEAIQKAFLGELEPLKEQTKKIKARVEKLTQETENLGITTAALDGLNVEIKQLESRLADTDKQVKLLEIEQEADPRVTLCQDAVWQPANSRKRTLLLLLGPVLAIGATCLAIAWFDFRARRIHSADEVPGGLGIRLVGSVPAVRCKAGAHVLAGAAAGEFDHGLIESIDGIRTMLLRGAGDATQVVMVTSAVGGEGKTSLASNLALSLARAGKRTLLIDGDLRRPALHELFEQTLQPGLSEAVLAEVELADTVRPTTSDENLWLLPAGQWDREVIQELAREGTAEVFERLRQEFEFIVVDSHPVLPANDALLIGQHADAVILSLMRGVSQAPRVYQATQKLADVGIRVFGAVVIAVAGEEYGRRYEYSAAAAA